MAELNIKPFLLLQSRPEEAASDDEYQAFLKFGGLDESQLVRVRMDQNELPELDLSEYSGVIMGGGPANFAYSDAEKSDMQRQFEPWLFELLKEIIERDMPFLGACLGMGAIAKVLGGEVSFDYSEPVEAKEIVLSDAGKQDPLLESLPGSFFGFVGHKEGVVSVPEGAVTLARSSVCLQMIRVGENVYATQFHPELDSDGLALRIRTYKDAGYFAPEEAEPLILAAYTADVTEPVRILQKFVENYSVSLVAEQLVF